MKTDILIIGSGCAGLYMAMNLPRDKKITIITKKDVESSDSYLAQGGMCVLKNAADYDSFFEDTMKAGHYENDKTSVDIMIRSSREVLEDLLSYGADFHRNEDGSLDYTREGGHSDKRIVYHKDITGKEITRNILKEVQKLSNVQILEYTTMLDIISKDNKCYGAVVKNADDSITTIQAQVTVLACGGIGGLYRHSTNFRHLTGDALAVAIKHNVKLKDVDYIQIHPTTLYSEREEDRSFLISESVRGEGAHLLDKNMNRFVNELLPRDLLTAAIREQMEKDGTEFVWEDLRPIPKDELLAHFPNIVEHCKEMGYDVTKECIPVVPAQHYFMGGIDVNHQSKTSMDNLYAIGETACNGVHGKNRLASNSLLESLVFAKRAAVDMLKWIADARYIDNDKKSIASLTVEEVDLNQYKDTAKLEKEYKDMVLDVIEDFRRKRTEMDV
ncbi:MAG: L-aspartate oxidase [Lachnospiraceae bacterium]|nr:L-aspartate oxidase [Lachnospiraceae bacterium]